MRPNIPSNEREASGGDLWNGLKFTATFLAATALHMFDKDPLAESGLDPDVRRAAAVSKDPLGEGPRAKQPPPALDGRYHTAAEFRQEAEKLVRDYPNLVAIKELGQSVEGRPLWCLVISDNAAKEENEPKTAYIAGVHGDERAQPELMLALCRYLAVSYGSDPRVKEIVDNSWIAVVVCANPDGWEKGTRRNANNVDINRDFPSIHDGRRLATKGRQPETLALMQLIQEQPFGVVVDFHATNSSGGVIFVNTPYDNNPAQNPAHRFADYQHALVLAHAYADAHPVMKNINNEYLCQGVTTGGGASWFQAPTGPDCACEHFDTTALTVELSNPKDPPAKQLQQYFDDNLQSFLVCLEASRVGFHLEVVDEQGKPINHATVTVSSSQRNLSFDEHQLHRLTPPGKHEVIVTRWGYEPAVLWAEAKRFDGEYTKVILRKPADR